MGSETLFSACYIPSDESSMPFNSTSNGYRKEIQKILTLLLAHRNIKPEKKFFLALKKHNVGRKRHNERKTCHSNSSLEKIEDKYHCTLCKRKIEPK